MRRWPSYLIRSTPEAARKEPAPLAFFLWIVGFWAFCSGFAPAVVGVAEVAVGALGDEFADLGGEGHAEGGLML